MEEKETQITQEQAVQTPRGMAALRNRYKEKEPEGGWDEMSDDDVTDRHMKDYDELSAKMAERDEIDKKMNDLFAENRQAGDFLLGMARGEDFIVNLAKNFGSDLVEAMNDPEKLEALSKANQEYQERIAKNKQLEAEWDDNMAQSLELLAQAQQEEGMSDDDVKDGMEMLIKVVEEYNNGKLSMDTIKMFLKAKNHDKNVANAQHAGEVKGRNANIEERMRSAAAEDDGTYALGGKSNQNGAQPKRASSIFDLAGTAK